jgi:hypothetical protein
LQVEGNDIVKKKVPASEPGGVLEMGLSGFSKKKELDNGRKSNGKAETIPIKPSALKCYSAAEESNMTNREPRQCNVNLGYDATGDEQHVAVTGAEGQTREKDADVSDSETHKGKGSEKNTKERERGGGEEEKKAI